MGFTPTQVGAMSEWEFAAAAEGWIAANCPDDDSNVEPPSPEQHAAIVERAQRLGYLH